MSQREQSNRILLSEIRRVHKKAREAYGYLKTWKELQAQGVECGKNRVARLRRINGIESKRRRRFKITTQSKRGQWIAPNILNRCFEVTAPNRVWVGDVTFVETRQGWLYLAVLIDLYSRKVIGWSMSNRINKELVLQALKMALFNRKPEPGLIHHTDRGSIYAADKYRELLTEHGIKPSMSRKGDCYDNAVAESFFATVKNELTWEEDYQSRSEAQTRLFEFIEVFYNRQRIHQTLGYHSPWYFEQQTLSLN
jgi:putative transposase